MRGIKEGKKPVRKPTEQRVNLERITRLLNNSGKSRIELAALTGINPETIRQHLKGQGSISLDTVIRYAEYFKVSTDYLLGISEAPAVSGTDEAEAIKLFHGMSIETLRTLESFYLTEEDTIRECFNQASKERKGKDNKKFIEELSEAAERRKAQRIGLELLISADKSFFNSFLRAIIESRKEFETTGFPLFLAVKDLERIIKELSDTFDKRFEFVDGNKYKIRDKTTNEIIIANDELYSIIKAVRESEALTNGTEKEQ